MPQRAKFLARGIPDAELEIVPGADHLLKLSRLHAFDTAIAKILTRVRGTTT